MYNKVSINPSTVAAGLAVYPTDVEAQISALCAEAKGIEALSIAREAGNGKAVNMVMVGTVMKHLPLKEEVITAVVKQISQGKGVEVNLKALAGGAAA